MPVISPSTPALPPTPRHTKICSPTPSTSPQPSHPVTSTISPTSPSTPSLPLLKPTLLKQPTSSPATLPHLQPSASLAARCSVPMLTRATSTHKYFSRCTQTTRLTPSNTSSTSFRVSSFISAPSTPQPLLPINRMPSSMHSP